MTLELDRLFEYDAWANRAAAASVDAGGEEPSRPLHILAHIVGADWLWWSRLQGTPPRMAVWPQLTIQECETNVIELGEIWLDYVKSITPQTVEKPISYVNSLGEAWTSKIGDVLLHVVFHAAYHRGQIATALRQDGHEPAYTDFIHAVRQGLIE
jgi:uncharacterized damage-inducible protein DinB